MFQQLQLWTTFQFRHPDITSNAHIVFVIIGLALVAEVAGYYFNKFVYDMYRIYLCAILHRILLSSLLFWTIFVALYLSVIITFTIHTYYNGMCRFAKPREKDFFFFY